VNIKADEDYIEMDDPQNGFQAIHIAWNALITVAGAIVAFFTKRLIDEVDKKADQCDVDELKEDFKTLMVRQDEQHRSNTERLDRIIMELGGNGRNYR
jgi:hypothetical protein